VHFIGMPEGFFPMSECALYLALAPKSNSVGSAYGAALNDVKNTRNDPVPMHLRNAVTGLMREMGYGRGYKYAHDYEGARVEQQHLPDSVAGHRYYRPKDEGWEGRRKREREGDGRGAGRGTGEGETEGGR
jgi:putative ATPase